MGIFDLFKAPASDAAPRAVMEAKAAISTQLSAAIVHYRTPQDFDDALASTQVVEFLQGFVLYFAEKHRLKGPRASVVLVETFRGTFGQPQASRMLAALRDVISKGGVGRRSADGFQAARDFDKDGFPLLAAFLKGFSGR